MAFIPFKKSNRCMVTDDLFLELVWEDGKSPDDDSELLGIIEGIDQQYFDTFQHTIEESLPYVTFHQAEVLFQELLQSYGYFQLKTVAIAHLEGREAVTEGEVVASPFIIDKNYQNLLLPLIQAIMTKSDFQSYSYQEKREYFENQIYPVYKQSLGVSDSSLPLFPVEGEQISPPLIKPTPQLRQSSLGLNRDAIKKPTSNKGLYILTGIVSLLAAGGLIMSFITLGQLAQKKEQIDYLYQEVSSLKTLASTENSVDVFSRYFLPTYYSGNKEALSEFLSDGDAKYTAPALGTLQSVILEDISYDSEVDEYSVTYVLSIKKEDKATSIRLNFDVKADDSAKYGYVVITEPKESDYFKQ